MKFGDWQDTKPLEEHSGRESAGMEMLAFLLLAAMVGGGALVLGFLSGYLRGWIG